MAVYSAKRNYLFLASPQTGSKAIAKTLLEKLDGEQIPSQGILRNGKIVLSKHHTTTKMLVHHKLLTEAQVQQAFKFCGVRNPFDLLVSRYEKLRGRHTEAGKISGHIRKNTRAREVVGFAVELPFPEWVRKAHEQYLAADKPVMGPMVFVDSVDHVIRFEALAQGFQEALARLGITEDIPVAEHNVTSQRIDGGQKRDYRSYYDDATVDLVRKLYAPVIERFGYGFDPH
ncbi:MAG TPA: sulfotransferase family 2 domain-containing protein [Ideonella sp.]|uniref:sulfotransferase family 2 domain-containing protein n=1 Tax=Ideonella sp. TaxID=1929293 RepID=UPI002B77EFCF|nr:sulfotransferase family 2 domain-containing protein [Ideonella sp.]HSI50715.1 sulfotransferase family 2 domain-containing protein [Ideonella sp.]